MSKVKVGNITVDVALNLIDVDIIRGKTPVATGNLRDSFTLDGNGDIINTADYADEIEFGTTKQPGRFMVTQSVDEIGNRLAKRAAEQLDNPNIIKLPEIVIKVG